MSLLDMSLSASILILAVVVVRVVGIYRLPKRVFIILWSVVVFRLLVPISIPSPFSIYTVSQSLATQKTYTYYGAVGLLRSSEVIEKPESETRGVSIFYIAWVAGMVGFGLFFILTHLIWRRDYKMSLPIENDFIRRWIQEHKGLNSMQIRQSEKIITPLTYGLLRPVILLPKGFDYSDSSQLEYILAHEYTHIRRKDVIKKWLLAAALSIHWFNPFVWIMYVLANRDIELYCDEKVVLTFGENVKSAYATALISLEERKISASPLISRFSKNPIEERIVSVMKIKKLSAFVIGLSVIIIMILTATLGTNAQSKSKPSTDEKDNKTVAEYERERLNDSEDELNTHSLTGTSAVKLIDNGDYWCRINFIYSYDILNKETTTLREWKSYLQGYFHNIDRIILNTAYDDLTSRNVKQIIQSKINSFIKSAKNDFIDFKSYNIESVEIVSEENLAPGKQNDYFLPEESEVDIDDEFHKALITNGMIKAQGINGVNGWVYARELEEFPEPTSPAEALERQNQRYKDYPDGYRYINVYDRDGVTVVDTFKITVGSDNVIYK